MSRRRGSDGEHIGVILKRLLQRIKVFDEGKSVPLTKKLSESSVIQKWPEIVGRIISSHTQPLRIKGRILFVGVDSSIWANELSLLKMQIISDLNKTIGQDMIGDIYFKVMNVG
ncbi:DUF721 domain-containing protein [bacterium]|nr:DUF721 domain-containing protein [bacterium]MBU1753404.1 DUF721 domain-containing protein [bacterium]